MVREHLAMMMLFYIKEQTRRFSLLDLFLLLIGKDYYRIKER